MRAQLPMLACLHALWSMLQPGYFALLNCTAIVWDPLHLAFHSLLFLQTMGKPYMRAPAAPELGMQGQMFTLARNDSPQCVAVECAPSLCTCAGVRGKEGNWRGGACGWAIGT